MGNQRRMNAAKQQQLMALLGLLPPPIAAALIPEFESKKISGNNKLPLDEILAILRARASFAIEEPKPLIVNEPKEEIYRGPSLSRLFFEPFEALFEDENIKALPGSFPRKILSKIWDAISEKIEPEKLGGFDKSVKTAMLRADSYGAKAHAARLRDLVIELLDEFNNPQIISQWTKEVSPQQAERFFNLLKVEGLARSQHLNVDLDLDETSVSPESAYTKLFIDLEEIKIEWAAEFALLLMANSRKPWQVVRFFKVLVKGTNDRKLSMTAFNVVGQRIFGMLNRFLDEIHLTQSQDDFDGSELAQKVEAYNKLNHGLDREGIMTTDGPWRNELKIIRGRAGQMFNDLCEKAEKETRNAYPVDKTKLKGAGTLDVPRTNIEPNRSKIHTALNFIKFIMEARLFAPLAGFSGARDNAQKAILRHSDAVKNGLVTLKGLEETGKFHEKWVEAAIDLTRGIEDNDAAKSFARRIAA